MWSATVDINSCATLRDLWIANRFKHIETLWLDDHVKMILRTSPSGSFTMRQSLSQIIVRLVCGSVGCQVKPGTLGFPVAAKAAHDDAIFFANA